MEKNSLPIHIKGLYKSFAEKKVLRGVDLDISSGESFVLLGRSGSGKSVLLKYLLGLLPIDRGVLEMEGHSIPSESRRERYKRMNKIGMVFQGSALFDSLPVWENVAFRLLMEPQGTRSKAQKVACEGLAQVGLEAEVAEILASDLSGGMQRRVALARAIAFSPSFLFLDEPTAGLDPLFSRLIGNLIQDCRRALGVTTLTITHDLSLARRIADRIGMIHEGEIIWQGSPQKLKQASNPIVQEFIDV